MSVPYIDPRFQAHAAAPRWRRRGLVASSSPGSATHGPTDGATTPTNIRMEQALALRLGRAHGIAAPSGGAALRLALDVLGVEPGDRVITPPYLPSPLMAALASARVRPIFVDIEPETLGIDPALLAATLEDACTRDSDGPSEGETLGEAAVRCRVTRSRVRAVLAWHAFGQMASMRRIRSLAHDFALPVIEEAGQAVGARAPDGGVQRPAGGWGDIAVITMNSESSVASVGDAGFILADHERLAFELDERRAMMRGVHRYTPIEPRSDMDGPQRRVLVTRLGEIDALVARRRALAHRYRSDLASLSREGLLTLPAEGPPGTHAYARFVLRTPWRAQLARALGRAGIGHALYYTTPLHLRPAARDLGYVRGSCPQAEAAAAEALGLPIHGDIAPGQEELVVREVNRVLHTHAAARARIQRPRADTLTT